MVSLSLEKERITTDVNVDNVEKLAKNWWLDFQIATGTYKVAHERKQRFEKRLECNNLMVFVGSCMRCIQA